MWLRVPGFLPGLSIPSLPISQFSVHMLKELKHPETSIVMYSWHLFILSIKYFQFYLSICIIQEDTIKIIRKHNLPMGTKKNLAPNFVSVDKKNLLKKT